jgi:hypothetical protein
LTNKKIVCVVPWDEHVIFLRNIQLENILNKYTNDPVYWITNLEPNASDVYTSQHIWQNYHLFKIKIIELPWWLLNDCLGYYSIADKTIHAYDYNETNYTCMINHATLHKFELPRQLKKNNLSKCGKFTIANLYEIPVDLTDIFVESTLPVFQKYNLNYQREGAQTLVNGVWISKNVENFNNIEKQIKNIPLVLNSETIMIKLFATEKSIWPILLGKLFLIHGRPNIMQ